MTSTTTTIKEPSSYSNLNDICQKNVALNWSIDFDKKVISGDAILTLVTKKDNIDVIVLDTRDLTIKSVSVDGKEAKFEYGEKSEAFGEALRITPSTPIAKKDTKVTVKINYNTSPNATAIQWLSPEQTAGKKHPYLFTQCQAIHCRSMIPIQDSPAVKLTYEAAVSVAAPLVALMSAPSTDAEPNEDGARLRYAFRQHIPIPSYLIALAVGALESRDIGPRSKVWSEASMVEAGAYEFADTEKFLKAGEELVGDYVWGQYDILLLPPSFPYGGMENTTLTFVTPTLIAGDRSLANVVAHEIAHSWSGNLVTNRTWEHFWLNEGFTVFIERAIIGRIFGAPERDFAAVLGRKALRDSISLFGADHEFTKLVPNLDGVDPDDAFSSVPYDKGFTFLDYLQRLVGGPSVFEPFLKSYIQKHAKQTVTTDDFRNMFTETFPDAKVDWQTWLYSTGMPPELPELDTTLSSEAAKRANSWRTNGNDESSGAFSAKQVMVMLDQLADGDALPIDTLNKLDAAYKLSESKNAEIKFRWYKLAIAAEHDAVFDGVKNMLLSQGRMKFVRPLYRALYGSSKGKQLALDTFKANRQIYHGICSKMVAADLGLK